MSTTSPSFPSDTSSLGNSKPRLPTIPDDAISPALISWLKSSVIGGAAACAAVTFTNPFEVIKTKLQLSGELGTKKAEYSNSFRAGVMIYKNEGLRGLQRGLSPAYGYQLFMNGTRLGLYDVVKDNVHRLLSKDPESMPIAHGTCVVAGATSGVAGALVASPLFLVKTRMQSQTRSPNLASGYQHSYTGGTMSALRTIYKLEGFRGLYHGVDAAMVRTGIGSAVQLSSYDAIKQAVLSTGSFDEAPRAPLVHGISSLLTGFLVCVIMTPPDVISTRVYNQPHDSATGRGLYYRNPLDCFVKTVRSEGVMALYK